MKQSKVAKLYAESLYDFAVSKNNLQGVITDVINLQWLFSQSTELYRTVISPIVKPSDKLSIIRQAMKESFSAEFSDFLALLSKKSRIDAIPEILDAFSFTRDDKEGILRVAVTSAVELTADQLVSIKNVLQKRFDKTIEATTSINTELIGGFVVKVGDNIIDASMLNKLGQIKKKFINTSISLN